MKNGMLESLTRGTKNYPLELLRFDVAEHLSMNVLYHWHPEIEITLVDKGGFVVTIDGRDFVAESGDVFFCSPNSLHSISEGVGFLKGYDTLIFSLSLIDFQENTDLREKIITPLSGNKIYLPPRIKKSDPQWNVIYNLVKKIVLLNKSPERLDRMQTALLILELFLTMYRNSMFRIPPSEEFENERIRRVTAFIEKNYSRPITLSELAGLCNLSEKYFCTLFKSATGKTPIEYVNCVRIKAACNILLETHETVTATAFECGFDNISYFIRQFTKIMGASPAVWRKNNINNKKGTHSES